MQVCHKNYISIWSVCFALQRQHWPVWQWILLCYWWYWAFSCSSSRSLAVWVLWGRTYAYCRRSVIKPAAWSKVSHQDSFFGIFRWFWEWYIRIWLDYMCFWIRKVGCTRYNSLGTFLIRTKLVLSGDKTTNRYIKQDTFYIENVKYKGKPNSNL